MEAAIPTRGAPCLDAEHSTLRCKLRIDKHSFSKVLYNLFYDRGSSTAVPSTTDAKKKLTEGTTVEVNGRKIRIRCKANEDSSIRQRAFLSPATTTALADPLPSLKYENPDDTMNRLLQESDRSRKLHTANAFEVTVIAVGDKHVTNEEV